MTPSEYRIEIKVRNNWLLKQIESRGYRSVYDFCVKNKLSLNMVSRYASLKVAPIGANGEWKPSFIKIAKALKCEPRDICPPQHLEQALKKNTAKLEVGVKDLALFIEQATTPEVYLEYDDTARLISESLKTLPPKEERVLRLRYGLMPDGQERTLREVGEMFGVGGQRIRQIEARALRRLKHPRHSRLLHGELGVYRSAGKAAPRHYIPEWKKDGSD